MAPDAVSWVQRRKDYGDFGALYVGKGAHGQITTAIPGIFLLSARAIRQVQDLGTLDKSREVNNGAPKGSEQLWNGQLPITRKMAAWFKAEQTRLESWNTFHVKMIGPAW